MRMIIINCLKNCNDMVLNNSNKEIIHSCINVLDDYVDYIFKKNNIGYLLNYIFQSQT